MSHQMEGTILHVTNRWELGGTPRYIHDLSNGMRSRGIHVEIAAWNRTKRPSYADEHFHALPLYRRGGERKSPTGFIRSVSMLRRYLKENDVSLVHTHSRYILLLVRLALRKLPVAHVHTEHNLFPETVPFVRYPRHVICPTECVRASFLATVPGSNKSGIHVIHHGIDRDEVREIREAHPLHERGAETSVIFLGRHTSPKGGQVLIEALRLLDSRGRMHFTTHFVGDGLEKGVWMKRARETGLMPRIQFHQSTPHPLQALALADVAVLPSAGESFGYSFVEAAALGLRIVASDIPAFRELREHGVPCTLVPEGDANALADALDAVVRDFTRSEPIPELPQGLFTLREMTERTLEVYSLAMQDSRSG